MNEQHADVHLDLGGGLYGPTPYGPRIQGEIKVPDVRINFKDSFCSKHPNERIGASVGCSRCAEEIQHVVREMLQYPAEGFIDCENIKHSHECKCHLGHSCGPGCHIHDRLISEQSKDANGVPTEPHPLFQVAAEAPSAVMQGVYDRLADLERDNSALKNLVTKVLVLLPEETRNEAITAAIREKLGLSEVVGSAQGVEEA